MKNLDTEHFPDKGESYIYGPPHEVVYTPLLT